MLNDPGHLLCDEEKKQVFFIQDQSSDSKKSRYYPTKNEVVSLNIANGKLTTITNIQWVSQLVMMDGRIIIPFRDQYYLLKGENTKHNESPLGNLDLGKIEDEEKSLDGDL
jgi:hypothetical protein